MPGSNPPWVQRLRATLVSFDTFMAGSALLVLLALVLGQVLLRNLFDTGMPFVDVLSRYLVLYVVFFGAALAVEKHRHIRIDALAALVEPERLDALRRPLYLLSAIVCAVMTHAAARFWYDDWQFVASHERWTSVLALVMPFGFGLLCVHFLLAAVYPDNEDQADT